MIYRVVALDLVVILVALLFVLFIYKILKNKWLLEYCKKVTNGIPFYDNFSPLTTHLSSLFLARDNCRKILDAHEKLGPFVGYLVGEQLNISTTDLDLIKRVVVDDAHLNLDRAKMNFPANEFEHSIMLLPKDKWRPVRRVFAPALRPNKFKAPNVVQEIQQSIDKLICHIEKRLDEAVTSEKQSREEAGVEVEVDETVHRYQLDLVLSCFYKQYDQIDFDATVCWWTRSIDSMFHDVGTSIFLRLAMIFPLIRSTVDWIVWYFHPHGKLRRKVLEFVKLQTTLGIRARNSGRSNDTNSMSTHLLLEDNTNSYRRNMIDHVIDAFLVGKLTKSDYLNTSSFLLFAADKTAGDSIVATIYFLSINPQAQERLRASLFVEGIESEYLDWVVHESLRLIPTVPGGSSRIVSHAINLDSGDKSPNYKIPANTYLAANAYVIHRLKKYWGEDADEFKPERWADTSNHHPMQFMAFGAGPRGCLGREFALFTMKSLLVALLTRYKFEGKPRPDVFNINAPVMVFTEPSSATCVTVSRLRQLSATNTIENFPQFNSGKLIKSGQQS